MCVERARILFERMRREHPFLTGSDDSVFAVVLARSPRSDNALIADMEQSYQILKRRFLNGDAIQTVSHILSLDDREPAGKVSRVIELYDSIRDAGVKYSRDREISVLASVSLADADIRTLASQIVEADELLHQKKGWSGIFGYSRRKRAMHAAMIVSDLYADRYGAEPGAISSTLASVIAQEMALCMTTTVTTTTITSSTTVSSK